MSEDRGANTGLEELEALNAIVRALQGLPSDAKHRVMLSVHTLLNLSGLPAGSTQRGGAVAPSAGDTGVAPFSEDRTPSPKEFLHEKKPITDVDRVACLGYYLAHYRDTPHFKTLDISKINTEAAQLKFSNAAKAVDNAAKAGLLVPATKGNKQLSAIGELYVQALPDRTAAKATISGSRPRRGRKTARPSKAATKADE